MVIFFGSCRLLGWTAPRWSRPQFQRGGCSSEIQLLERLLIPWRIL